MSETMVGIIVGVVLATIGLIVVVFVYHYLAIIRLKMEHKLREKEKVSVSGMGDTEWYDEESAGLPGDGGTDNFP